MGFNLFKKKENNKDSFDELMKGPPKLDLPEKPSSVSVPEPPKLELPPLEKLDNIPMPKEKPVFQPKEDFPKIPKLDIPPMERPAKLDMPKLEPKNDLPEFPEYNVNEGIAPIPPAYFSEMDNVREDMAIDHGGDISLLKKPIFVEVNDYKKLRRTIKSMETDAKKSKEIAAELSKLKVKKENKLNGWDKQLETIQRNLIFTDKMLFEEGGPNV